jgi:zinc protease
MNSVVALITSLAMAAAVGDAPPPGKADAKPADAKPADAKPAEAKPAEAKPADAKPAEAAPAVNKGPEMSFEVDKYTLDNGLEVLLHRDARQPFVTVNVTYHVGARDEEPGKTGFAHLFEHLMFQGSQHVPGDGHIKRLEEVGAEPINGTTDFDITNYYETVPRHQLDMALWMEADRMGYLMEGSDVAKLNEQRAVVKNERRQNLEGRPYGVAQEKIWQALLPKTHPYYADVIGSMEDLDRASFDDVRRFYDAYYAPSNATLCIVGDYDPATIKDAIKKYFGTLPKWVKPTRRSVAPVSIASEVTVEHAELVGKEDHVELVWLTPAIMKPGNVELDLLASVLGDGLGSRLQNALVVQSQQATEVGVYQQNYAELSVFTIAVNVKPGVLAKDVLAALQAQLDFLVDAPITTEELERAKSKIETSLLFSQEIGVARSVNLQYWNHYAGDPNYLAKLLPQLRAATPASVMAAFSAHLPKDKRGVLLALKGSGAPAPAPAPAATDATKPAEVKSAEVKK